MVKVVPKDEFCGLADNKQISIASMKDLEGLELSDTYEPDKKEISEKVVLLEQSALNLLQLFSHIPDHLHSHYL